MRLCSRRSSTWHTACSSNHGRCRIYPHLVSSSRLLPQRPHKSATIPLWSLTMQHERPPTSEFSARCLLQTALLLSASFEVRQKSDTRTAMPDATTLNVDRIVSLDPSQLSSSSRSPCHSILRVQFVDIKEQTSRCPHQEQSLQQRLPTHLSQEPHRPHRLMAHESQGSRISPPTLVEEPDKIGVPVSAVQLDLYDDQTQPPI
jgi:hypothetical protein